MVSSPTLFNNQRFRNAAIHMEIAQHANYPFARQTTKGLIQSTDKFAHSKNAGCLSQSRRKLQQRMVASEMAICYSQSDQFNSRSNRTTTGRCRNLPRTRQRGNMPILLKTRVERTAKAPIPARRARVGGLCGFQDTVERVPAGSPKTGRCADVRENKKFDRSPAQRVRLKKEMRQTWETPKRAKSRDFGRCGEKAAGYGFVKG